MSETQEQAAQPADDGAAEQQQSETASEKPEVDWKAKAREWERRAKENKAAAEKLAEIEQANKSEAEKSADRMRQLETDAATARSEALRLRIATKHGISDEDADLLLTGVDEDTLTRQAKRLVQRESDRKKQGNVAPREGANPTAKSSDEREMVRSLFGRG